MFLSGCYSIGIDHPLINDDTTAFALFNVNNERVSARHWDFVLCHLLPSFRCLEKIIGLSHNSQANYANASQ
jgi:hypothetical protein